MQAPYLMHIPELDELWLIDGEQRFLITPKIYDLLVSNGADNAKLTDERERLFQSCKEKNGEVIRLLHENAKLRELVDGLTWCCENYGCRQECPLYDVSEPDHCREVSIKRELGVGVQE